MDVREAVKAYAAEGFECKIFSYLSYNCAVIIPKQIYPGAPWVWRTEFFGCFDRADRALLVRGWHIVYAQMSDWYGAPHIIAFMKKFCSYMVSEYHLKSKADIFGFSRGGLYALNYAAAHPDTVSSLYLDAPVIDLASWPGGFYHTAPHLEKEWKEACNAYGVSDDELKDYKSSLNDKLDVLIKHQIKLLLVAGKQDTEVPYQENGALLVQYYYLRKGCLKVILKKKCGHHPHSLEQPEEIVEFITRDRFS